ncbi:heme exporter protein CcmD [Sulfitobacter sp. SK012]|uniref:heme exporter protein CcmD n=1 Tax=Sulfitobacter sp. SK012 TaxID=1389005 RepID=UPI000E0BBE0B|nr:heme exporter protein CcmD [Sulfitobacter sp. SK012]AXI47199.1 heme exporter protein CcmD [Sulfitobacter sp. SK012]
MPDLGKYAITVLLAYGVSGLILVALVLQSLVRHRRLRRKLSNVEDRRPRPEY